MPERKEDMRKFFSKSKSFSPIGSCLTLFRERIKALKEMEKEEIKKYRKSLEFKANRVRSGKKNKNVRKSAWVD